MAVLVLWCFCGHISDSTGTSGLEALNVNNVKFPHGTILYDLLQYNSYCTTNNF